MVLRERGVRALEAENSMMTMTTMADGLEAPDSSKSAFMEFGQQSHSQQSSPSMAGGHYPLHCLHSGSHTHHQHDSSPYSGTNSYNRSLPYPYVSHPQHSPYLPSYHNNTGGQTRLDGTGKLFSPAASCQSLPLTSFGGAAHGLDQTFPCVGTGVTVKPPSIFRRKICEIVREWHRITRALACSVQSVFCGPVQHPPLHPPHSHKTCFNARGVIITAPQSAQTTRKN